MKWLVGRDSMGRWTNTPIPAVFVALDGASTIGGVSEGFYGCKRN
jgi:hypothetical protein